jgi:DNA polymerase-3 subunit epsilon
VQAVQAVINQLVRQRAALKADVDERVRQASARHRRRAQPPGRADGRADAERGGVQPGRPHPALQQPRAAAVPRAVDAAAGAGGAELLGIGRSIYAVFDRQLVAHALDGVQQRLQRGAATRPRSSSPARAAGSCCACRWRRCARWTTATTQPVLSGFVLMLDNITRDFADESERDRMLHQLTETSRASLGNLQAAVELLDDPGLDADTRERFQGVVRDEVAAMSRASRTWPSTPRRR